MLVAGIYIWDIGSNNSPINLTTQFGNNSRDEDPKYSHTGTSIVFKQNKDIKIMSLKNGNINSITNDGDEYEESMPYSLPFNSPIYNYFDAYPVENNLLFFSSTINGANSQYDLFLGNAKTGEVWDLSGFGLNTNYQELGAIYIPETKK